MRALWLTLLLSAGLSAQAAPQTLSWPELIPKGAPVAAITSLTMHDEQAPTAVQPAPDAPVVIELHQHEVRLPGYIVPLDTDANGGVLNFFLVPYYGACIHVPPPAANQIIYVQSAQAVVQEALWQPYWVQGTLYTEPVTSDAVQAGYRLQASQISRYTLD